MKKENMKLVIALLISCAVPMIGQAKFGTSTYVSSPGMFYIFWGLINFLFVSTLIDLSQNYRNLFKLKNLKINKLTFIINILVYFCFLIFINCYFVQQLYIRDNHILNIITDIKVLLFILILFVINLYCGQFPESEVKDNTTIYSLNTKTKFKYGHENFGHVIGEYADGITIGFIPFNYSDIKSVYADTKNKALVIKGKNKAGNFRINIAATKSKEAATAILRNAKKENKLENGKFNI